MSKYDEMFGENGLNTLERKRKNEFQLQDDTDKSELDTWSMDIEVYFKGEKEFITVSADQVHEILKKRPSIVLYRDWLDNIKPLDDQQAGKWIRALLGFANNNVEPDIDDKLVAAVLVPCLAQLKRDTKKYVTRSIQNRINQSEKKEKGKEQM